jgi:hypothetical protein
MDIETISNIILESIKRDRKLGEKLIQKQKKTWLRFPKPIPTDLHKPITRRLKQEGETIRWLSDTDIEIKLC